MPDAKDYRELLTRISEAFDANLVDGNDMPRGEQQRWDCEILCVLYGKCGCETPSGFPGCDAQERADALQADEREAGERGIWAEYQEACSKR